MKPCDLAAGLAATGIGAAAEQRERESLYIPRPRRAGDRKLFHDFMDEFAFVEFVTCTKGLTAGTYFLKFTAGGPGDYTAPFDVK